MKLVEYELSRAIRFFTITPVAGQVLYGANMVKALQARYGFVEVPNKVSEYDLKAGVTFLHGFFMDRWVIDRFQVYDNGLMAEAKVDTEELEAFLDDVVKWAASEAGMVLAPNPNLGTPFLSQMVFESSVDLSAYFSDLAKFAAGVSAKVASYGLVNVPAQVSGLHIGTDPALNGGWNCRFERRVNAPFSAQLFFSSAPLKTSDHLTLLMDLEEALTRRPSV